MTIPSPTALESPSAGQNAVDSSKRIARQASPLNPSSDRERPFGLFRHTSRRKDQGSTESRPACMRLHGLTRALILLPLPLIIWVASAAGASSDPDFDAAHREVIELLKGFIQVDTSSPP